MGEGSSALNCVRALHRRLGRLPGLGLGFSGSRTLEPQPGPVGAEEFGGGGSPAGPGAVQGRLLRGQQPPPLPGWRRGWGEGLLPPSAKFPCSLPFLSLTRSPSSAQAVAAGGAYLARPAPASAPHASATRRPG